MVQNGEKKLRAQFSVLARARALASGRLGRAARGLRAAAGRFQFLVFLKFKCSSIIKSFVLA